MQDLEFAGFNGPILVTTNCIIPVAAAYKDRIFTTGVASYPGIPHIPGSGSGSHKDFSPLIEIANRCQPALHEEVRHFPDKDRRGGSRRHKRLMAFPWERRRPRRLFYNLTARRP
jgi:hydroxylamine reductase (hybrid-cluster protein)